MTFKPGNGSDDEVLHCRYYKTLDALSPAPIRTGYTFGGWCTDVACTNRWQSPNIVAADLTLYAKWTANRYTVTFDPQGGICDMKTKLVTYDSSYGDLPIPTHSEEDREFIGWFTAATGGDQVTADTVVKITGNQTLYAHWNYKGEVSQTTTYTNITGPIDLWVGETRINGNPTNGSGNIQGVESVSYDASTKTYTLVLRGYRYEGEGYTSGALNYCIYFAGTYQDTLVIELKGDNSLKNTGSERSGTSAGIYVDGANLTIKGDGTLNITTGESYRNYGICVEGMSQKTSLIIEGGVLNVTADVAYNNGESIGLNTDGQIYISGGTITAKGYTRAVSAVGYNYLPAVSCDINKLYRTNYDGSGDGGTMEQCKYFHAAPKTN